METSEQHEYTAEPRAVAGFFASWPTLLVLSIVWALSLLTSEVLVNICTILAKKGDGYDLIEWVAGGGRERWLGSALVVSCLLVLVTKWCPRAMGAAIVWLVGATYVALAAGLALAMMSLFGDLRDG